jgi:CheY-like chemotaxis protein
MVEEGHLTVLMADDDEDDCFLAKEALFQSGAKAAFSCVEDGEKLMEYLSNHSQSELTGLPHLILLDLNMPRKDGRQALREIKAQPTFRHIPVIILTTSDEQEDIDFTLKAGVDSFITKPSGFEEWVRIMKFLADKWLI